MEKCEMKFRLVSSNSRGLSLARAQVFCIRNWRYFKRGLFIYFVVDTWNVLPVMSENDKSAGLWKVKVRSCFVMCLLMVTKYSNNEAGDQSEIIDRSDIWTRNFKMAWKTIYWFLFVYWRHNCSRCCKWLMEFYVNKLILDQILADLMYRSNRSFNMPPPGIWLLGKLLFKFPPTRAKMPFKCMPHTRVHSGDQMPPPRGHFTGRKMTEGRRKRLQLSNRIFINITKTEKHG